MKRNILTISLLAFLVTGLSAQNEQDVLRYSFLQTGGTTRSLSMGGALGAVGGDFSAISINPAGLGIYRSGEFSLTGDFNSFKASALYLGSNMADNGFKMGFSQFGAVIPLKSSSSGPVKGLTFAIGYNKLRDFGQNITIKAVNNQNSMVDVFVNTANNNTSWDPFADGLAWETYLIDYDSLAGVYFSDFTNSNYGQTQRRTVSSSGSVGDYNFSLGMNLSDRLYIGAAVDVQSVNYNETWEQMESDPNDVINFFNSFSYRNTLNTRGRGVNLKLGILARPIDFIRLGATIQTPTNLKLSDDFQSFMSTELNDGQGAHTYSANGQFNYNITTPLRATGSVAFIFQKYGLISLDYEYVDYSSGRLRSSTDDFFDANEAVAQRYKAASNVRVGGELRLLGNYYVRGGYALYGSPYVAGEPNAGKNLNIISGGLGYRDNNYYLDLGFARSAWDQEYFLYGNNSAAVSNTTGRFTATLGFKF
jgi:hypothetical protein